MIDLEYSRYITELLMDNELNEKLRSRRFDALRKMRGITAQYEEEKFLPELVETVFCKKADFIMKAKNPYIFKINGKLVRIRFSETDKTAEDCLTNVLKNLYR